MNYKTLNDIQDVKGKRVLMRLDLNVPIQQGKVVDDFRIRQSQATIDHIRNMGAKIVIISHIEGESDTLRPVYEYLKNIYPISFCEDCAESGVPASNALLEGEILLCENLRLYDGEKKNDQEFSKKLASLGDIYINDAFSVSHRKHASVVGVAKLLPAYLGAQFEKEVAALSECFNPAKPFLFILGGAKFDTKLPLVEKFLPIVDTILIGGALANDFYKAEGLNVGQSRVSDSSIDLSPLLAHPKILVPVDVIVDSPRGRKHKKISEVEHDEKILDAGEDTVALLAERARAAKFILWNGPLGNYENGYREATEELAKIVAASTHAKTIIGGGDTLAVIKDLGIEDKFTFISTGGGAMLDYLAKGTLPGLDALKK